MIVDFYRFDSWLLYLVLELDSLITVFLLIFPVLSVRLFFKLNGVGLLFGFLTFVLNSDSVILVWYRIEIDLVDFVR